MIATGFMDFVALTQKRFMGIPSLNYAMVGRWIGHIPNRRIIHRPIGQSSPIPHEAVLGWAAHYLIGVVFAAIPLLFSGPEWAQALRQEKRQNLGRRDCGVCQRMLRSAFACGWAHGSGWRWEGANRDRGI